MPEYTYFGGVAVHEASNIEGCRGAELSRDVGLQLNGARPSGKRVDALDFLEGGKDADGGGFWVGGSARCGNGKA